MKLYSCVSGLPEERHHQHRRVVPLRARERLVQARQEQVQALEMGQAVQMPGYNANFRKAFSLSTSRFMRYSREFEKPLLSL